MWRGESGGETDKEAGAFSDSPPPSRLPPGTLLPMQVVLSKAGIRTKAHYPGLRPLSSKSPITGRTRLEKAA